MHEILGLKHVFSTFQETVWSHVKLLWVDYFLRKRSSNIAEITWVFFQNGFKNIHSKSIFQGLSNKILHNA